MKEKVAVVTGGTAGVGRAVVDKLIAREYAVAVLARGQQRLDELRDNYPERRLLTISCDVADAAAVVSAAQSVSSKLGTPVVWVNCAMLTSFSAFMDMEVDEFDRIVDATFIGQVNGTRAALSTMHDEDKPVIINVGSGLSYRSVPLQSAYCASKHAINGFSAALRSELIRDKRAVDLCLIQLPAVNTPQFSWARSRLQKRPQPAPPAYQPEFAATAVMRAIDRRDRELFVGQSVLKLVFGTMVLPDWLDHKLADSGAEMQTSSDLQRADTVPGNLFEPVAHPSVSRGAFSEEAENDGLIVNADLMRKLVFFGVPVLAFLAGLILG